MKRRYRLTRSSDFQRVRRYGKSYAHPLMVLVALPNQRESSRFGVAAGRSLGGAVRRNRAKRRLRAVIALYLSEVTPGWDALIIARRAINEATFRQTEDALVTLLQRAELFSKEP